MSRENRAKQFMPFAALKGLEEALEKKEKIVVPKAELCDDYKEQLDFRLSQMQCGDMVTVVYFSEDNYVRITGILSKIKLEERWIQVVRTKNKEVYFYECIILYNAFPRRLEPGSPDRKRKTRCDDLWGRNR